MGTDSGVARSLVLAGHLQYASHSHMLRVRLRDMSAWNMNLACVWNRVRELVCKYLRALTGHVPARPGLRYTTGDRSSQERQKELAQQRNYAFHAEHDYR